MIKIDRSFITDVARPHRHTRLIAGIIALARELGVTVVAEGIERIDQAEHLRQVGCPSAQGWLYSKAVPADEFASLLDRTWLDA